MPVVFDSRRPGNSILDAAIAGGQAKRANRALDIEAAESKARMEGFLEAQKRSGIKFGQEQQDRATSQEAQVGFGNVLTQSLKPVGLQDDISGPLQPGEQRHSDTIKYGQEVLQGMSPEARALAAPDIQRIVKDHIVRADASKLKGELQDAMLGFGRTPEAAPFLGHLQALAQESEMLDDEGLDPNERALLLHKLTTEFGSLSDTAVEQATRERTDAATIAQLDAMLGVMPAGSPMWNAITAMKLQVELARTKGANVLSAFTQAQGQEQRGEQNRIQNNLEYQKAASGQRLDQRKQREIERHNKEMEKAAAQRIDLSQDRLDALGKKGITIDAITRQMAVLAQTIPALTEKWGAEKLRDVAIENLEAMQSRIGGGAQPAPAHAGGSAFDTSILAPDELKEYEAMSPDAQAAFRKAMGGG